MGRRRAGGHRHVRAKRYHALQLVTDDATFDLVDQQRSSLGNAFEVGPGQKPVSNCPGFDADLTLEDVPELFPDGLDRSDISAWSYPRAR